MKHIKLKILIALVLVAVNSSKAQEILPYLNTSLSFDERVDDLVSRMTLEEKVGQMMNDAPAIPRLNILAHEYWNEALHGVARAGKATVFPQAIGLGATFDEALILESATVISDEARAKHHEAQRNKSYKRYEGLTYWTPNVNIFRDPRWGRGQETYGEDPYLTSRMGISFVKGLQGDDEKYLKLVATPKHFAVHSGPEPERHFFDAITTERDLYDTYLPAFEATVKEGQAYSIMGAYNRYMGKPCCASHQLLDEILRQDWGFKGFVVSDCNAIRDIHDYHNYVDSKEEAAAVSLLAGTDLNCGSRYEYLVSAVKAGLITEADVDVSLKRIFKARFKLGMFDPTEMVPYASIPMDVVSSDKHRALALETAQKSIVLLKNENKTLPIKKDVKSIAVVGPNANELEVLLGNYNGFPSRYFTPLDGIKSKVSKDTKIYFEAGIEMITEDSKMSLIPTEFLSFNNQKGLQAKYYNNHEFTGTPVATRIEDVVNSNWNLNPVEGLNEANFGVEYTGTIKVDVSGEYDLGLQSHHRVFTLAIDGKVIADNSNRPKRKVIKGSMYLEKGKSYDVKIQYIHHGYPAKLKFMWASKDKTSFDRAIEIAKKSEVVVFVGGISASVEGEHMPVNSKGFDGGDKVNIDLPAVQTKLLKALHETGTPVVLVLLNGSALAINWENDNLPAIVEAWYPGELGGTAIADVLFGDYNPSGRLPVTFYTSHKELSPFVNYSMKGRTYRYYEGEALYPFGFGLSYTKFNYEKLKLDKNQIKTTEATKVSVKVKNVGDLQGEEVVQLYIKDLKSSVKRPLKSLRGIKRITLKPGKSATVTFNITPEDLQFFDTELHKYVVEPGEFEIGIGPASNNFETVTLNVTN
ncbi:glycoside hydrolase family 3 C-terminal domain-containing protein [Neotamlana laminarinivorans]|uniref:Glycoside hydrolase family 3 C-terminal domain-containing protein n=1 Tax=Neotamlana laminarinivorans TaxID=2883124 RepID=A0A9X1L0S2_9FLAO|nr:glycoside hydrolase family 3 C-terminal domain-containing protein [Tamlana laminarinivorans]MCB4797895.1 glycoside hydrolase family 3 C-terminal domain-containing protein [Tamlana laminarinivorans]